MLFPPLAVASLGAITSIAACGSHHPEASRPIGGLPGASTAAAAATATNAGGELATQTKDADTRRSAVNIDPAIVQACGLPSDAAHFDFDSSRIRTEDDRTLAAVATCFESGPLKGRQLRLVGHADPRGDAEYNMVLGQARADSVAMYVMSKGLPQAQTTSTSRGAMDAIGTDEAGWSRDRRVDLVLGP
jgi:peptidoglycan-associated lipoprotein